MESSNDRSIESPSQSWTKQTISGDPAYEYLGSHFRKYDEEAHGGLKQAWNELESVTGHLDERRRPSGGPPRVPREWGGDQRDGRQRREWALPTIPFLPIGARTGSRPTESRSPASENGCADTRKLTEPAAPRFAAIAWRKAVEQAAARLFHRLCHGTYLIAFLRPSGRGERRGGAVGGKRGDLAFAADLLSRENRTHSTNQTILHR